MRWLGFDWGEHLYHASDYFEQLYDWARRTSSGRDWPTWTTCRPTRSASTRGTLTEPGRRQPLARPLRRGEPGPLRAHACRRVPRRCARPARAHRHGLARTSTCATRSCTASSTPAHPRTGDAWCIYPTYDFAHGQSDAIEGVTHSICTLEFADHRPLYDWLIEHLPVPSRPRQYEFARLNLTYTVLSKRFLLRLVEEGRVRGWDDPRMPTDRRPAAPRLPRRGDPRLRRR